VDSPGCLDGVRVLELASPRIQYAGKLCGDMGADVIKIEPPGGDVARHVGPFVDDIPDPNRSIYFWHYNTSKRAITLELQAEQGRQLFERLLATTDVVLEGFDPDYLGNLGLDYDHIRKINPRVIMASLTEFGQDGPWRHWKGGDLIQLALGGTMASTGYDDPTSAPIAPGGYQAEHTGGHYIFIGVLAALLERATSLEGQYIDVAIHDALSSLTDLAIPTWIYRKRALFRNTGQHAHVERPPQRQFRCKDGRYLNTLMPNLDASMWHALVSWLDSEGMAEDLWDEKYRDPYVRKETWHHWMGIVGKFIESHDSQLMYHGAQVRHITWAQVRAPEETLTDLHLEDRGFWAEVEHPEEQRPFTYPGAPYPMPEAPWKVRRRAPLVGEHNFDIYGQELGLTKDDLVTLAESRVI